ALYSYRKKKATTWVVTKGTLSATQGYRSSMINYSVNGRTITHKMINPPFNAVDGEQYIVHYDSANPNEYEVEFWNPIFSESEQTSTIIGTISRGPFLISQVCLQLSLLTR